MGYFIVEFAVFLTCPKVKIAIRRRREIKKKGCHHDNQSSLF